MSRSLCLTIHITTSVEIIANVKELFYKLARIFSVSIFSKNAFLLSNVRGSDSPLGSVPWPLAVLPCREVSAVWSRVALLTGSPGAFSAVAIQRKIQNWHGPRNRETIPS